MKNITINNITFVTYVPEVYTASIFAGIVYFSLVAWFIQAIKYHCRPCIAAIMIFVSHLLVFIELVLRATLDVEERNTEKFFSIAITIVRVSTQLLLASSFQFLTEMRGDLKPRPIDIIQGIIVPIGLISSGVIIGFSKKHMLNPERQHIAFLQRRIAAGILMLYIALLYVFWYFNVTKVPHRFARHILIITSICLFTDALFVLATTISPLTAAMFRNEIWFYIGHTVPVVIALITWTLLYWRKLPPTPPKPVAYAEPVKETLLSDPKI